ncbi:deaminase domain-containing protein [Paenibacillus sp. NPDC056933]|uniref:deaminase domain-containing protein n=1 Tax=Paenibacillus sp. NPDC056933 TaxID=3345968 RepID=UPI003626D3F9
MDNEGYIIDRVAELKQRLSNGALNKSGGNFGYMEVDIPNIKTEFYAHSQVNGSPPAHQPNMNYDGFSFKPETIRYPAKDAPDKQGDMIPREGDTEYKMINELAK